MMRPLVRRKFLKTIALGGLSGAGALAAPSVARAEPKVLKMQAAWAGGIFLENAQSYVDRVNAMAGKDLRIDLLAVNSVVETAHLQDAVHRGVIDAAHYVPSYWYSKSKTASLFGAGPCFGWSSQEVLGWIHYGGGQKLFDELMVSLGMDVVSFFNSPMPAQPLGWFKDEIKHLSDMKGLKYRTVGLAAEVMKEMGLSVVQLAGEDIPLALKSGEINSAEFNNPTSDRELGLQDMAKEYHLAAFNQVNEFFEITFNKTLYDALPTEHQAILKFASEAESSNFYWNNTKRYAEDLEKLKTEDNVKTRKTPDTILAAQLAAWDKVIERTSQDDPFFAKVIESQKSYAKIVMGYLNQNQPDLTLAYNHYFG